LRADEQREHATPAQKQSESGMFPMTTLQSGIPVGQNVIMFQPVFPKGDWRNDIPVGGAPGNYEAVLTFRRSDVPPVPPNEVKTWEHIRGDSHVQLATDPKHFDTDILRLQVIVDGIATTALGHVNDKGFLSRCVIETIAAANFLDAENKAIIAISPWLSSISFKADVPLQIAQIDIIELASGSQSVRYSLIAFDKTLPPVNAGEAIDPIFRGLYSLYREAENSNSETYKFLCYYKITELLREFRNQRGQSMSQGQRSVAYSIEERFPSDEAALAAWLKGLFPFYNFDQVGLAQLPVEVRGKKANNIMDTYLRPLRVKIAHALTVVVQSALPATHSRVLQQMDDPTALRDVLNWLPAAKCIARLQLQNEISLHAASQSTPNSNPQGGGDSA